MKPSYLLYHKSAYLINDVNKVGTTRRNKNKNQSFGTYIIRID